MRRAVIPDMFKSDTPRLRVVCRVAFRIERHGRGGLVGMEHTCHRPLLGDVPAALLAGHAPPVIVVAPPAPIAVFRTTGATSPGGVLLI